MQNITLLLSTIAGRILTLDKLLASVSTNINIIIIIQKANFLSDKEIAYLKQLKANNLINISLTNDTGVTKSRNLALSLLQTEYGIFCDDDIFYLPMAFDLILNYFINYPDADFLTFNVVDEQNNVLKKYPEKVIIHTKRSILKVGTIEVAVRISKIRNIKFPEDMGAGQYYYCCDEPVYLGRILDSGGKGYHIPLSICSHPRMSSGKSLKGKQALLSRYICFCRLFGNVKGKIIFFIFLLKNIRQVI